MAHFAQLNDDYTVQQVIVIANDVLNEPHLQFPDTEPLGQKFIADILSLQGQYRQTSYNGNFRGRYAGIGFRYDAELDQFIAPQPYPSWTLDAVGEWQPPVTHPNDGGRYSWDEGTEMWVSSE